MLSKLAVLLISSWLAQSPASGPITLRPEALAYARAHRNDAALRPASDHLLRAADAALEAEPVAVTQKHTLLPPSNDPHDYFSLSPYWWPDPNKPDGLPYIRRDGQTNPESKRDLDQPRVAAMGDRVQALALAYYLSGAEKYAEAAARQIRAWFLDPATRMNPHLRYAQLVRGNPQERGSGIIDTRWFIEVIDAVGLLQGSHHWTTRDQQALQDWFRQYNLWLRTSPNGEHERNAQNNHGSWYAAQTATYALFSGDSAVAREIIQGVRARIAAQIRPDGSQPQELVRTRSLHYSAFNVEALSRLAEMGRKLDVDLWKYEAPNGGSLRAAATRVARYVGRESEWPGQQITPLEAPVLLAVLRRAQLTIPDPEFAAAITRLAGDTVRLDRSSLLYPPMAGRSGERANKSAEQRSAIFLATDEARAMRDALGKYPLLDSTFARTKAMVERALANKIAVPPPGEAGGYEHERHKQNYREMQAAGLLYRIAGDEKYGKFVKDMLEKYALLYPTLGAHPLSKNQAPGRIFHQSLNEANWLVAVAIAYDCVYDYLKPDERARFEKNVLRPMADWLSVTQAKEFDRIHNHGTWATASVGMLGLVIGDTSYVSRALYGTQHNGTGGFLRQLDLLFSPDGYYMEGPYYIRYALMPFFYFAEALNRTRPDVHIFEYRDSILKKGLYAAVQTAFPNGVFPPINDASRTMDITSPEVVLAVDLAYRQYGANPNLLGAAYIQNEVILNGAGLAIAKSMSSSPASPKMSFRSVEFTDGADGKGGGLGILRSGEGRDATMLLMKYGVHGQGHGHFDKLHFSFFDGGREVVPDYGFARWINIEPKFGGRYLPENDSYAMQTIAHNTVVVDQTTQSAGQEAADEANPAQRNWFDASRPEVQAMSARADRQYPGVAMQRTMLLVHDDRLPYPVVVDVYRLNSDRTHTYDYPIHYRGQLIAANVKYAPDTVQRAPLGKAFGYQHVWREAWATTDSAVSMTWLDGHRYYTMTTSPAPGTQVIFGRTGANDPNFNLMVEPMVMVRRSAARQTFASVIEPHGFFSEVQERSEQARPRIKSVQVRADTPEATILEITGDTGLRWVAMIANGPASATQRHSVVASGQTYEWNGNFAVEGIQHAN